MVQTFPEEEEEKQAGMFSESVPEKEKSVEAAIGEDSQGRFEKKKSFLSAMGQERLLFCIWAAGCLVFGGIFFYRNIRLWNWLKKDAKRVVLTAAFADRLAPSTGKNGKEGRLPAIYYQKRLASPCLAGLLQPTVFLNEKSVQNPDIMRLALLHELMHYRQRDHLWNLCRSLLCVIYWFHPFVWWGAAASARDAELACDERVVSGMKRQERKEYGLALLDLLDDSKKRTLDAAAGMTGGKKEMKERIDAIARRTKTKKGALTASLVLLLLTGLIGCSRVQEAETAAIAEESAVQDQEKDAESVMASETAKPDRETEIRKKEALFSAATPVTDLSLIYQDAEIMMLCDYFGLVIFAYGEENPGVVDTLDLTSFGCSRFGGMPDGAVWVSKDGTQVYLLSENFEELYRYDRMERRLYKGKPDMLSSLEELYVSEEGTAAWKSKKIAEIGDIFISCCIDGKEESIPIWNEKTREYMKALKARYDQGEREQIVDEGWNGSYGTPDPVKDLGGGPGQWRRIVSSADEYGNKIENPYEYSAWFEKTDGSKRLAVRSFDELICSWQGLLFYRYDKTIYVTREEAAAPFFSLEEGSGSIELYASEEMLGIYHRDAGNIGTLTFYDRQLQEKKKYSNVRLEAFSEECYCLLDLETGLYGFADGSGELLLPFAWSFARGFHNGYAVVLTDAETVVYYEDGGDKMFDHVGGFWGIIDRQGNYAVQPEEKYSNSVDFAEADGTMVHYVNGPVGFADVEEDGSADFVRWEDQEVLFTVTVRQ